MVKSLILFENSSWLKRGVYDEPRLSELIQMYHGIGFEVLTHPFEQCDSDECSVCGGVDPNRYKVLFTRTKSKK